MIPALLSCVYVIYLYRKLRDEASPPVKSAVGAGTTSERIAALEARLLQLAEAEDAQGATS